MSITRLCEEMASGRINYVVISKSKMTDGQFFSLLHSDLKSHPHQGTGSSPEKAINDALSLLDGVRPTPQPSAPKGEDLDDLLG